MARSSTTRPLADRILRPIGASLAWIGLSSLIVAIVAGLAFLGVAAARFVGAVIGDGSFTWPVWVVGMVLAVGAAGIVAAAAFAAAYASAGSRATTRATVATLFGAMAMIGAWDWSPAGGATAVAAIVWAVAIPAEHWTRHATRALPGVAVALAIAFVDADRGTVGASVLLGIAGILAAGVAVVAGDVVWRRFAGAETKPGRVTR